MENSWFGRKVAEGQGRGFSLVETVVGAAILGLVVLGVMSGFRSLSEGVVGNAARQTAIGLTEGKIAELRRLSYMRLSVATAAVSIPGLSAAVPADLSHFGEENLTVNKMRFKRYVHIEKVRPGADLDYESVPYSTHDTGQRRVTVTTTWTSRHRVKHHTESVVIAKAKRTANVSFQGQVNTSLGVPIANARVSTLEDSGKAAYSSAGGNYTFNVRPGTYTLVATAPGYFPAFLTTNAISYANSPLTRNFSLVAQQVGSIVGTAWMNDHLVISRIAGSTVSSTGYNQEYVEVYNPTASTWTMAGAAGLALQRAGDPSPQSIELVYTTTDLPPGRFYLLANTTPVRVNGVNIAADARWNPASAANAARFPYFGVQNNVIPVTADGAGEGSASLLLSHGGLPQDQVGWKKGAGAPPFAEAAGITDVAGLEAGETYSRFSTTNGVSGVLGPAYDSGHNDLDFSITAPAPPRNILSSATVQGGTPADGAYVFADDGLSVYSQAVLSGPPYVASYTLSGVATGTWTVMASSGGVYGDGSVVVNNGATTTREMNLSAPNVYGFLSGRVVDYTTMAPLAGVAISPGSMVTGADGRFRLSLPEGEHLITANPDPGDPNYTHDTRTVTLARGQAISGLDFRLARGVTLRGRFMNFNEDAGLEGYAFYAVNLNTSMVAAEAVSDSQGYFDLIVPTGPYTVMMEEALDETMTGNLVASSGTYGTPGTVVVISTFTTDFPEVRVGGQLTDGGHPVRGGVFIVACIEGTAVGAMPPDLPIANGNGGLSMATGRSDGTYEIAINTFDWGGGTLYNIDVHAWYSKIVDGTVQTVKLERLSLTPVAGSVNTVDFAW